MSHFSEKLNELLKRRMASLPMVVPAKNDPISISDKENIRLSAVLWSDLHFSAYYSPERAMRCRTAMIDLSNAADPVDALVIAGDLAENGKQAEKEYLAEKLRQISSVRCVIPASGNHDTRFRHIEHSKKKFSVFCEKVNSNIETQGLYYSYDIEDYTFIVLGTARTEFENCYFDEAEFGFLKRELDRATRNGKPVFVVLHQPLRRTHNLPASWDYPGDERGAVGKQSEQLRAILNSHENVFLISGHLHRGFSENTYEEVGRIHSINVPSLGMWNKDSVYGNAGMGFLMEVYDSCVLFRPRDFLTGSFIHEYDKKYFIN